MSGQISDNGVKRLEALAARFYPGQFTVIDETVDDLVGVTGMRVSLVTGERPGLRPEAVKTVAMASFRPIGGRGMPDSWRQLLLLSKGRPWRVDLFVPSGDVAKMRSTVRQLGCSAGVIPLPRDIY